MSGKPAALDAAICGPDAAAIPPAKLPRYDGVSGGDNSAVADGQPPFPPHIDALYAAEKRALQRDTVSVFVPFTTVVAQPGASGRSLALSAYNAIGGKIPVDVILPEVEVLDGATYASQLCTPYSRLIADGSGHRAIPRPCVFGASNMCIMQTAVLPSGMHIVRGAPVTRGADGVPRGPALQELMLPSEALTFASTGQLPATHKMCLLCHACEVQRVLLAYHATMHSLRRFIPAFSVRVDEPSGFQRWACAMPPAVARGGVPWPEASDAATASILAAGLIGPVPSPNLAHLYAERRTLVGATDAAGLPCNIVQLNADAIFCTPQRDRRRSSSSGGAEADQSGGGVMARDTAYALQPTATLDPTGALYSDPWFGAAALGTADPADAAAAVAVAVAAEVVHPADVAAVAPLIGAEAALAAVRSAAAAAPPAPPEHTSTRDWFAEFPRHNARTGGPVAEMDF